MLIYYSPSVLNKYSLTLRSVCVHGSFGKYVELTFNSNKYGIPFRIS